MKVRAKKKLRIQNKVREKKGIKRFKRWLCWECFKLFIIEFDVVKLISTTILSHSVFLNLYIYIYIYTHTHAHVCLHTFMGMYACIYIYIYIYIHIIIKVKLLTIVWGNLKAPFSISTTPRCRREYYFFPWIAPLYPWYIPYNAEYQIRKYEVPFFKSLICQPRIEPWSLSPLVNTLQPWPMGLSFSFPFNISIFMSNLFSMSLDFLNTLFNVFFTVFFL